MTLDTQIREQLQALLTSEHAHMTFEQAVTDFPPESINTKPPHVSYTPWHLLEHLRRGQWNSLELIINPEHVSPPWPEGYWPAQHEQADQAAWEKTIASFRADLHSLSVLIMDPQTDLATPIPYASGQTVLREILVVADHNAYHIGEFAILRQIMQTWTIQHEQ